MRSSVVYVSVNQSPTLKTTNPLSIPPNPKNTLNFADDRSASLAFTYSARGLSRQFCVIHNQTTIALGYREAVGQQEESSVESHGFSEADCAVTRFEP